MCVFVCRTDSKELSEVEHSSSNSHITFVQFHDFKNLCGTALRSYQGLKVLMLTVLHRL